MLTTTEPTVNLGEVKFGKPHLFTYTVQNSGPEALEITKLGVGCTSCTKASILKTKLNPGDTSTITVVFTPGTLGKQNKVINVEWDKKDTLKLTFVAESHE